MDRSALTVRHFAGLGELFHRKVSRRGSHSEALTGKINGIRAVVERHTQALHIPGRSEKFYLLIAHNSELRQRR